MKKITSKEIRRQLKMDLIGKDAFRGVTFSYSYLCNQFGHFSLGFFLALAALAFNDWMGWLHNETDPEGIAALMSAGVVLLFEIFNYTYSIYIKPKRQKKDLPFKKDSNNLLRDLTVDLLFFWIGAVAFHLCFTPFNYWGEKELFVFGGGVVILVLGRSWYIRKIYQQQAFFPFSLRLAQIEGPVIPEEVERIQSLIDSDNKQVHLLLYGDEKHENNELAVAMGNEFAIKKNKVYYTSFLSFLRMCYENYDELMDYNGSRGFWTWRETNYLIIDHMLSGGEVQAISYEPDQLLAEIYNDQFGEINKEILLKQNIIWVVGDIPNHIPKEVYKEKWRSFLIKLGVNEAKIMEIDLDDGM